MEFKELLIQKFENFQFLIASNIVNEQNEHFIKLMDYKIDDVLFFYESNLKPYYGLFSMDTIVNSFCSYLELPTDQEELNNKIKKYFECFIEIISSYNSIDISINENKETEPRTNSESENGQTIRDENTRIDG